MCYRCRDCGRVVQSGVPQRKRIVYRSLPDGRTEIEREWPVCHDCSAAPTVRASVERVGESSVRLVMSSPPETTKGEGSGTKVVKKFTTTQARTKIPRCDVCGARVGQDGQVTAESVLCRDHLPKERGRKR